MIPRPAFCGLLVVPGLFAMIATAGAQNGNGEFSVKDVDLLEKKIQSGAPERTLINFDEARRFWSFQLPHRHAPPGVRDEAWLRGPVDAFLLAELERAGLAPNPPADRRTLIRRLSFDLTGLPPAPNDVEAFAGNESPEAYEDLVERLLASPHYGERWARLWMDVMRYAEDQAHIVGENSELFYPNAYLYRDWLIAAFNADVPYDRFIKLQLAADLMDPSGSESHAALGFIGLGPKYYRRSDPEVMADEWEDRIDVIGRGLLGLTVTCARCHDHKYDPIPTEDYYALAGVFASIEMFNRPLDGRPESEGDGKGAKPEDCLHIVREIDEPQDLHVLIRGDINARGAQVPRRFLRVLSPGAPPAFTHGSGRLDLAEAIVDPANPLTARVFVNRVWAALFGRPLVSTPSNFGALGERPTHPELLDDLAVRFVENGWSVKWLHRQIVLSAAYRQSSAADPAKEIVDPGNRLLWRMHRRRLEVEPWRDAVLAAAGSLDDAVGGKSVTASDPEAHRRTVYSRISRLELDSLLALFDFPDPNLHSPGRGETSTPLQKLFLLNNPFVIRQADALANRLHRECASGDAARIRRAYQLLYGRPAGEQEVALGLRFLKETPSTAKTPWQQYAQVLLASNELLYLD